MATAENTQAQDNTPDTGNPRKRKVMLLALAVVVLLAIAGVWAYHEFIGRFNESTDDAYVNGNVVEITPLVTGTVVSIGADDGDLSRKARCWSTSTPTMPKSACKVPRRNWRAQCVRCAACIATSTA